MDIAFLIDDAEDEDAGAGEERVFLKDLAGDLRDIIGGAPVDVVIQPHEGRRKKLLIADMDSTMIGQECIDELADYAGLKSRVAAITERAMRGEIAFEPALRERVALLKGLPATVIDTVIDERIRLTPGGPALVATMRANGAYTCLVSGGFTAFTSRIAAMIGFDEQHANTLLIDAGGKLTGEVAEPMLGREAKLDTLDGAARALAARPRRHACRRRRRQRHPDDRGGRAWRRLPRQASHKRSRRRLHRPRRSHRAALRAGLSARGVRRAHLARSRRRYCRFNATNRVSPSALETSSTAIFLPWDLS